MTDTCTQPEKSCSELIESISEEGGKDEVQTFSWMAGLLESLGEGSFSLDNRSKKRYKNSTSPPGRRLHLLIKISMTDEDVIDKMAKLVNKTYFSPESSPCPEGARQRTKKFIIFILEIGKLYWCCYRAFFPI